jgi:solute carrier family 24 (sodium/potassium/calcium exchanger), member 6
MINQLDYEKLITSLIDKHPLILYFLIAFILLSLFYSLYSIADRHLTWALYHLSKYCRLSPSMAGITFLALGNGAPDFFTNVFGAQEAPEMALGGSIGSSLFIGVFVLGLAIVVYKKPASPSNAKPASTDTHPNSPKKATSADIENAVISKRAFMKNLFFYALAVGFLGFFIFGKKVHLLFLILMICSFVIHLGWSIIQHLKKKTLNREAYTKKTPSGHNIPKVIRELLQEAAYDKLASLSLYRRIPHALWVIWKNETEMNKNLGKIILNILTLPFNLLFNLSILPLENLEDDDDLEHGNEKRNYELVASLRCIHRMRVIINIFFSSLLWKAAVFGGLLKWELYEIIVYVGYAAFTCSMHIYFTHWRRRPNFFYLHVLSGFCGCILWIYLISKELVGLLQAVGERFGIDEVVMGSTILAWGNSFGDLVSIFALARNGQFETALTACFCGPIQNVLLTLAIALSICLYQGKSVTIPVRNMHMSIYIGWSICVGMISSLLILGPMIFKYRFPRWFGFSLIMLYVFGYIPLAILSFFNIF